MIQKMIYDYVKDACEKPDNFLSKYFFDEHLSVVAKYSEKLSDLLKADKEILVLSSYLHDISAVFDIKTLATHNKNSAEIAKDILLQNNYPKEKVEKVFQCIFRHTSPIKLEDGTVEEVCLSNADAISQIINPSFWLYFAFKIRNLNYEDGKNWYLSRINDNWNKLVEPAKNLIKNEYYNIQEALTKKIGV